MGIQDRAAGRCGVIGVIGVPAAADVGGLVGFFEHLGDLGMSVDGVEETVDVDVAESTGERLVLVRRELLISEEQHAVLGPRVDELTDDEAAMGKEGAVRYLELAMAYAGQEEKA